MTAATAGRREALRGVLERLGVAGAALTPGPALRYFTGWDAQATEHLTVYLLPVRGHETCVVTALDREAAAAELDGQAEVFPYRRGEVAAAFHAALSAAGLLGAALAVEALRLRLGEAEALQAGGAGPLRGADGELAACRRVRDAAEIAASRRAVAVGEAAFRAVLPRVRAGVTEDEVARWLEAAILEQGGLPGPKRPAVLTGPRSAFPHGQSGATPLRPGDVVVVDWSARCDGYLCDITRTLAVGTPPPAAVDLADVVLRANRAGVAAVRPGAAASAPDAAVRAVLRAAGAEAAFVHGTGHGVGLDLHEGPSLGAASTDTLAAGMVVTVEPGVYLPGRFGIRIEDDVLVTAGGAEVLTTLPRELVRVPDDV
jgi:Xaa-Pro dipeptidase